MEITLLTCYKKLITPIQLQGFIHYNFDFLATRIVFGIFSRKPRAALVERKTIKRLWRVILGSYI